MSDLVITKRGLRFQGQQFPCSIGRGGVSENKREGDGATPYGVHRIVGCLYRPDRIPCPNGWAAPTRIGDLWSDDSADPDYNNLVRAPHGYSHEALRRADRLYDLVLLSDWNWPNAAPRRGSAIFVHRWRKPGHPTEGCVALSPDNLFWIAQRLDPGAKLVVNYPRAPNIAEPTLT